MSLAMRSNMQKRLGAEPRDPSIAPIGFTPRTIDDGSSIVFDPIYPTTTSNKKKASTTTPSTPLRLPTAPTSFQTAPTAPALSSLAPTLPVLGGGMPQGGSGMPQMGGSGWEPPWMQLLRQNPNFGSLFY